VEGGSAKFRFVKVHRMGDERMKTNRLGGLVLERGVKVQGGQVSIGEIETKFRSYSTVGKRGDPPPR